MGFSLELFFEELKEIQDDRSIDEQDMLAKLEECINDARTYAKECGMI